ncbi:LysR family transcriptional regulator [Nocardioides mesophilus]|uniref:LysR family transcriptional regulator n=1 Tax=Nocardioides mesophilus TaxID=433659 RepID=UPI001CB72B2B|nr:LysR family transcriptional regulator [Nocardioides mesophilus]
MDLDTRHLRALVAIADHGTFTDAAIALRVSQASVSRSVQRLEAALGVRLLARTTRQVEPTAAGERTLVQARRILATLAQLEAAAVQQGDQVLVGYAWAALGEHTVEVQRAWADQESRGDLVLVQSNTPTAGLREGRCEVAVVRRPVADPALDSVRVGVEQRCAVFADDHPLAARSTLRLRDLAEHPVAVDVETGTTDEGLWPAGAAPSDLRMTRGVEEWLTLIATGRAVGVTSEATAAQHPAGAWPSGPSRTRRRSRCRWCGGATTRRRRSRAWSRSSGPPTRPPGKGPSPLPGDRRRS